MGATRGAGERRFLLGALGLIGAYAVAAVALVSTRDFDEHGPLSLHEPARETALEGAITPRAAASKCFPDVAASGLAAVKVVGGLVENHPYYACYRFDSSGSVLAAAVVDGQGFKVNGASVIKKGGAWPWVGTVTRTSDLVVGGVGLVAILGLGWSYYRSRPPPPNTPPIPLWQQPAVLFVLGCIPVAGWVALGAMNVHRKRKARAVMQVLFSLAGFMVFGFLVNASSAGDTWGTITVGLLGGALSWAILGGRLFLRPRTLAAPAVAMPPEPPPTGGAGQPASTQPAQSGAATQPANANETPFSITPPADLPSFTNVGGMDLLKRELKDTFGLMLAFAGEAREYRLKWNGLLLHGPPGVGKTFIARATAGEFGLNFMHVTTADIVSSYAGEAARNIRRAFSFAAAHVPCILFFDEFDSIAQRRDDWPNQEARRTVNELLRAVEEWRKATELIVMAATNDLDTLDPAVIRPGRFDRHIRVDLPDAKGRAAIFAAQLKGRPVGDDVDLDELAQLAEGLTPAAIAKGVEAASLSAFREATAGGSVVRLTRAHLRAALTGLGGTDRPTVEQWTWDQLVLPKGVKEELQQVVAMVHNPDLARSLGVEPPTGVLLSGPPGTGKTTIAKVLAAQAGCSFYPVTGADVTSMWLGESERSISRLFERARENRPSIIFFDEIDAIAGARGEWGGYDRQINQLLAEIDGVSGQRGVLVVGATNRPDQLDPALLRGGRLSRQVAIPVPDLEGRVRLLAMFTARMPLEGVDLDALGRKTEGQSGADLKALCQQAAVEALTRVSIETAGPSGGQPAITAADMAKALVTRAPDAAGAKAEAEPHRTTYL